MKVKFKRIRCGLVAPVLLALENEGGDKHVENVLFRRLDEGSNPSWSTFIDDNQLIVGKRDYLRDY